MDLAIRRLGSCPTAYGGVRSDSDAVTARDGGAVSRHNAPRSIASQVTEAAQAKPVQWEFLLPLTSQNQKLPTAEQYDGNVSYMAHLRLPSL